MRSDSRKSSTNILLFGPYLSARISEFAAVAAVSPHIKSSSNTSNSKFWDNLTRIGKVELNGVQPNCPGSVKTEEYRNKLNSVFKQEMADTGRNRIGNAYTQNGAV